MHKLFQFLQVFIGIKSNTLSFASISSGTSGFLIIPLQAFRNIIVNHITHIRFVNTHTESNRGHDHIDFFHKEIILILCSCGRIHSGMIGTGINPICLKYLGKFLYFLPAQAIDDTRLFRIVLDELDNILIYVCSLRTYLIIKVRTIERRLEHLCFHHTQILLDIVLHLRCGGCSQCNERSFPDFIDNRTNTAIFRSEVMSPFRNTMGLIYGIERNLNRFQELHILFFCQRLRSYIQQFRPPGKDIGLHLVYRTLVKGRIDEMSYSILLAEITHRIDLILHQGNQRRNHNGRAVHQQRG